MTIYSSIEDIYSDIHITMYMRQCWIYTTAPLEGSGILDTDLLNMSNVIVSEMKRDGALQIHNLRSNFDDLLDFYFSVGIGDIIPCNQELVDQMAEHIIDCNLGRNILGFYGCCIPELETFIRKPGHSPIEVYFRTLFASSFPHFEGNTLIITDNIRVSVLRLLSNLSDSIDIFKLSHFVSEIRKGDKNDRKRT